MLAAALLVACGKPEPPRSSSANPTTPSSMEVALAAPETGNDLAIDTWLAARVGNIAGLEKGLTGGVDVNSNEPKGGGTLSEAAVIHGQQEIVELLLEKGADAKIRNSQGATALHSAAFFCRPEIVGLLVEKGADIDAKNKRGKTPLDTVEEPWVSGLSGYYTLIYNKLKMRLDIASVKTPRAEIVVILRGNKNAQDR